MLDMLLSYEQTIHKIGARIKSHTSEKGTKFLGSKEITLILTYIQSPPIKPSLTKRNSHHHTPRPSPLRGLLASRVNIRTLQARLWFLECFDADTAGGFPLVVADEAEGKPAAAGVDQVVLVAHFDLI
jgi:hypothetical protein